MCDTWHEWLFISLLHSAIGPTTLSVSCCRPALLQPAVILTVLIYRHIRQLLQGMVTHDKKVLYSVRGPHTIRLFLRSDYLLNENRGRSVIGSERTIIIARNKFSRLCFSLTRTMTSLVGTTEPFFPFFLWGTAGAGSFFFSFFGSLSVATGLASTMSRGARDESADPSLSRENQIFLAYLWV